MLSAIFYCVETLTWAGMGKYVLNFESLTNDYLMYIQGDLTISSTFFFNKGFIKNLIFGIFKYKIFTFFYKRGFIMYII